MAREREPTELQINPLASISSTIMIDLGMPHLV